MMQTSTTPRIDRHGVTIVTMLALALMGTCAPTAQAQVRASISGIGGVSAVSSDIHGAVGGRLTFDLSPRLAVEGSVIYTDEGRATSALASEGRLLVSLLPSARRVRPFAAVGLGIYRARFDMGSRALMTGRIDAATLTRMMGGYGLPGDVTRMMSAMPQFYASRAMATFDGPMGGNSMRQTFTDPAVSLGGGLTLTPVDHVVLSPEARVYVVTRGGRSRTTGMFTMGAGYRW